MVTHSFEFVLGIIFLAFGSLQLLLRWVVEYTRFGDAMRRAHLRFDDYFRGWPSVSDTMLGLGVIWLVAGTALTMIAFIAYAGL